MTTDHRLTTRQVAPLLQSSELTPRAPGEEHLNHYLEYEFVFERRVDT